MADNKNIRNIRILSLSIALVALVLDQASKYFLIPMVQNADGPITLTPFFNLVMVWNHGISFGMFSGHGQRAVWPLIIMALGIVGVLLRWLWRETSRHVAAGIGLVIGGALANVVDRVRFGAVADFFDVHAMGYHWPAFNIADSAICIGVAILVWDSIFMKRGSVA